jgi:cold shock CspA family protein
MTPRVTGTIEVWYDARGWGFARSPLGGRSVFVHLSDLDDQVDALPRAGDAIEFTAVDTPRGPRATDARIVRPRGGARG